MRSKIVRIPLYDKLENGVRILVSNVYQYADDIVTVTESVNKYLIRYHAEDIKEVVRVCLDNCGICEQMYIYFSYGGQLEIEKINFEYHPVSLDSYIEINNDELQKLLLS